MFGCRKTSKHKHEAYQLMRSEYKKLGSLSFAEGCILVLFVLLVVLWFTRDPGFMPGWASLLFNQERKFVTDTTVSVFISIMFFIIPSKIPQIFSCNTGSFNLTGRARVRAPQTLLPWSVLQKKIPWNVMLLLGGALALAKGTEISGLSMSIAQALEPLKNIPPVALLFLLCLLVAMLTEICSNTVISTMLLPVLASMAATTGLHPLYLMVPPTISASFSFMLPVATPTNALTFTYTHMKVIDMVKPGFMLNLIGILCINLAINTWGTAMFQLNEFPAWANINTSTTASPLPSGLPTIPL